MTKPAKPDKPAVSKAEKVSTSFLCHVFGVSRNAISEWVRDRGMPQIARGMFDMKACLDWWLEEVYQGPEDDEDSIKAAKLRLFRLKGDETEQKIGTKAGEWVTKAAVRLAHGVILSRFRNAVRSWRSRLPPILAGKSEEEMLPLIEKEMDDALTALHAGMASVLEEKPEPSRSARPTKRRRKTTAKARARK